MYEKSIYHAWNNLLKGKFVFNTHAIKQLQIQLDEQIQL